MFNMLYNFLLQRHFKAAWEPETERNMQIPILHTESLTILQQAVLVSIYKWPAYFVRVLFIST